MGLGCGVCVCVCVCVCVALPVAWGNISLDIRFRHNKWRTNNAVKHTQATYSLTHIY